MVTRHIYRCLCAIVRITREGCGSLAVLALPPSTPLFKCIVSVSLAGLSQEDACASGTSEVFVGHPATAMAFLDAF